MQTLDNDLIIHVTGGAWNDGWTQYPLNIQTLLGTAKQFVADSHGEFTNYRVGKGGNTVELQYGGGDWIQWAPSAD